MNKDERLEKAKNGALHLFAELGLTLYEVGEAINMIRSRVQAQSNETKIDPKLIQTIIQQQQKQREEEVARASKAVFGDKLEYVNKK